jgi:hypothetical protein
LHFDGDLERKSYLCSRKLKTMMTRKTLLTLMLCLSMLTATARDYNIVAYGAKADTTVLSTKALQQAIDDCSKDGGGRVIVPTGQY